MAKEFKFTADGDDEQRAIVALEKFLLNKER
ncbi:phosphotransferase system HPr-like phosphotransfer protein [Peribacillus sp. B2I2]|jgi:phosphotransferase system HPr-like phosphotransfer protein